MKRTGSGWRAATTLWLSVLIAFTGLGCSGPGPTAPRDTSGPQEFQGPDIAVVRGSVPLTDPELPWYTVGSKTLYPLTGGFVSGSRYRVTVPPLALLKTTTISVREYSPNVIDFELLPHGTQFLLPVTVTVDYAGTSLDPASPNYEGGLPLLFWLNPATGLWELVPGVNNPLTKQYTVLLTHFSRYSLGKQQGTAEW